MHPLKRKRLQKDLSLEQLKYLTQIDISTLSRLERCQRKMTVDHLRILAKALECTEQDLIPSQEEVDLLKGIWKDGHSTANEEEAIRA